MGRKPDDDWAVLAVTPEKFAATIRRQVGGCRKAAYLCGHASHTHIYRLMTGATKTTSIETADKLEAITGADGLLFARMSARSNHRAAA